MGHHKPVYSTFGKVLELRRFDRLTTHVNAIPPDYKKVPYQIEFSTKSLIRILGPQPGTNPGLQLNIIQKRNEKIIEDLGLERVNYGRIAYMLLMQHCHAHNTDLISRLSKPDLEWLDEKKHLILTHNAIVQLDIIPEFNKGVPNYEDVHKSILLMSVLDQKSNQFRTEIFEQSSPKSYVQLDDIQTFYNMIDEMLNNKVGPDPLWLHLEHQLKELPDIGRLQRKLEINKAYITQRTCDII